MTSEQMGALDGDRRETLNKIKDPNHVSDKDDDDSGMEHPWQFEMSYFGILWKISHKINLAVKRQYFRCRIKE